MWFSDEFKEKYYLKDFFYLNVFISNYFRFYSLEFKNLECLFLLGFRFLDRDFK